MSTFVLTDSAIERALMPGLDVAAPADFTSRVSAVIATQPRRSRSWVRWAIGWPRIAPAMTRTLLLLLLLLALLVGAIAVASVQRRAPANGVLIIARNYELVAIDPDTSTSRSLLETGGLISGVARSEDGSLISFWTETRAGFTLEVVGADGNGRRVLAADVAPAPVANEQIDVWSGDRRFLASGVLVGRNENRILLVEVSSGEAHYIGPPGAANPLWSPDGRWLAFTYPVDGRSVLAVMRPDGSDLARVGGDLGEFDAAGTNNWSPDGVWVYFGAQRDSFSESHIYRANVAGQFSERLTTDQRSAAPALSPDGTKVSYANWRSDTLRDLKVMDADGAHQSLVLEDANNLGWSNDSEFLLTEWRPTKPPYELLIIQPDGTGRKTLMSFEFGCGGPCVASLGWGQPRP